MAAMLKCYHHGPNGATWKDNRHLTWIEPIIPTCTENKHRRQKDGGKKIPGSYIFAPIFAFPAWLKSRTSSTAPFRLFARKKMIPENSVSYTPSRPKRAWITPENTC
jgi:hypothetical protein